MTSAPWFLRAALALPFLLAFVGKALAGPQRFRRSLSRYRALPRSILIPASWGLIALEGAVGVLLLTPWMVPAAWMAGILGLIFSSLVTASIRDRRDAPCHCFGSLGRLRLGPKLLLLDLTIAAAGIVLALAATSRNPAEPPGWRVVQAGLTAALLLLTASLLVSGHRERREGASGLPQVGLPAGSRAPHFSVPSLRGEVVDSNAVYFHPCLLLFVAPDCTRCEALLERLGGEAAFGTDGLLIIASGGREAARRLQLRFSLPAVAMVSDEGRPSLRKLFRIPGAPAGVEIAAGRTTKTVLPVTADELLAFTAARKRSVRPTSVPLPSADQEATTRS